MSRLTTTEVDSLVLDLDEQLSAAARSASTWLAREAPRFSWPSLGYFDVTDEGRAADQVTLARSWERHKHDAGFAGISLPTAWGGQGRTEFEQALFVRMEAQHDLPLEVFAISRGMALPTLVAHGSGELAAGLCRAILRGEHLWCQLFSEPDCGSDLGGIRTRAVGAPTDGWSISGRKVWTSRAQFADRGLLLTRTGETAERHRALTMFAIPMSDPAVHVRPIEQLPGSAGFCEVTIDDLRLSDHYRIGPVDGGFGVALATLGFERAALAGRGIPWARLARLAPASPALGELEEMRLALATLGARGLADVAAGRAPGPEGSVAKLLTANAARCSSQLIRDEVADRAVLDGDLLRYAIGTLGSRIGGGTEDIQRNTIAERVLGLPRDHA